jgi:uncharacterized membrane protein
MNTALWIVAGLLSVIYLFSGIAKLVIPREKLGNMMHASQWALDFSSGSLKAIGVVEILGAIGLMLPALLDIAPYLVPVAALGLVLVMAGAVIVRLRRNESGLALVDLTYLLLAAFVVIGRFGPESFTG